VSFSPPNTSLSGPSMGGSGSVSLGGVGGSLGASHPGDSQTGFYGGPGTVATFQFRLGPQIEAPPPYVLGADVNATQTWHISVLGGSGD